MSEELCIYCKERKTHRDFNKEHVLPKSFGKFKENLTIINAVCKHCNGYFSKELDLFLSRDSLWGLMRYRYGLSHFDEKKWQQTERMELTINDARLGEWNGAIVKLAPPTTPDDTNPSIVPVPQVAFFIKGSKEKVHFALDKLPPRVECEKLNLDLSKHLILGNSDEEIERIITHIKVLGLNQLSGTENVKNIPGPKVMEMIGVSVKSRIDSVLLRSAAKIALNYTAKVHGKAFVLNPSFDRIREFIRYGKHTNEGLVIVNNGQLLTQKHRHKNGTNGHVIILRWKDDALKRILCDIALFNYLIFTITLCESFKGFIRPVGSAHIYDLGSKKVHKLTRLSLSLPTNL